MQDECTKRKETARESWIRDRFVDADINIRPGSSSCPHNNDLPVYEVSSFLIRFDRRVGGAGVS